MSGQIEKVSSNKYIEINSAYRNRNDYPNPAEFLIEVGNPGQGTDAFNSSDVILDSYPIEFITYDDPIHSGNFDGGTNTRVKLDSGASTTDNAYNGARIENTRTGEQTFIQSYNGFSQTALLYFPFSEDWLPNDAFEIQNISDQSHIYDPNGKNIDGYNVGNLIYSVDHDEFRTIIAYDAVTQTYTLDSALTNILANNDTFEVRKSRYISRDTSTALTATTITLAASEPSTNNIYRGQYIRFVSGTLENEVRLITAYDGTTKIATFTPSVVPVGTPDYEILQFSRDNVGYIDYYGSGNKQQGLYEIELLDLVLPNVTLDNDVGGRIAFYPYVYVELTNISQGTNNIISSNNPNSSLAVFRCPIVDTNSPLISTFIKIDSNFMRQVINFNPMQDLKFRVFLPDGTLFKTVESDNVSPLPPNDAIQISALFRFTKI